MYVYLKYKFDRKIEMVKLMLDRATYMKLYGKYTPEIIATELTKNNEAIVSSFDKFNKDDLAILSRLMYNDSMLFLEVMKSGKQNMDKIKMWRDNASEIADKLNEMDERRWSKSAGERLFHEFQNNIIVTAGPENSLVGFDDIRNNAVKIGLFIA